MLSIVSVQELGQCGPLQLEVLVFTAQAEAEDHLAVDIIVLLHLLLQPQ